MPISVPAIKGKMGSIEFYQTRMRARELTSIARPASELDDWANFSIDERIQRELNKKRVREEIAPYLAKDPDRFFGSILVLVQEPEEFTFEPLSTIVKGVPLAYKSVADQVGTLTIDGGELIVLDGQHRYAALRMVIQREADGGSAIEGPFAKDVPNDDLVVVLVSLDTLKTRSVFSKINKHAKTTSTADNIITSEADGYAIVTRRLLEHAEPLGVTNSDGKLLVNWKKNTLGPADPEVTTIAAVYAIVRDTLTAAGVKDFDEKHRVVRPSDDELDEAYEVVADFWRDLIRGIDIMRGFFEKPDSVKQCRALDDFDGDMLLKPAVHVVLAMGVNKAVEHGVTREVALSRLNKLDWSSSNDVWDGVLLVGDKRVVARAENYKKTSDLLAYLASAETYSNEDRLTLERDIAGFLGKVAGSDADDEGLTGTDVFRLPKPLS